MAAHTGKATAKNRPAMELDQLAGLLMTIGCPREKSAAMAAQLDKRAKQLAEQKNRTYEEALAHLVGLMRQGWAAHGMTNDK
ncbi:MAG TPA: hypothetical protein VKA67_07175 [Verrucomicrobiae bacterium]|nr:hypothetical protein [Verrucomicrobiae bacterium]